MSRHLRLIAAVAVVLVALSGFSPGRKGGGSRSGGKSGGCSSSSSSSHNGSGSGHDSVSKDRYGSGGGSYSGSRRYNSTTGTTGTTSSGSGSAADRSPASGTVTQCAARSGSEAKAVVQVRNPKSYTKTYRVKVKFVDTSGLGVDYGEARVRVGSRDTQPVDVRMAHPKRIGDVSECLVESVS
ncbi:hypothetical protein [Streptomyces sp. WMMB 322]|uniref:hypothetical protein n=1 Tax=Streptomyces sp. WMMB 322 TaxID=1286821 RepID=UPI0006E32BD6|nr:hypothetical protein [Streptomyces sp. WMMB 322]SCK07822.1 hypothetical protein H180DRAFT_00314 [Streptomyces sp. WMMB 322]